MNFVHARRSITCGFGLALVLITSIATARADTSAGRQILAADASTHRIALLDAERKIIWERKIGDIHDLHFLPNGHILFQDGWTHLIEVIPGIGGKTDQVVWEYDAAKMNGNEGKPVQVHAFQRLDGGNTMIAESGPARIIDVDGEGKIVHEIHLHVDHPSTHSDTRLARKLANGHYLVCHEADGVVREYDADGTVTWEYPVPLFDHPRAGGHGPEAFGNQVFGALRLSNGNTLVATGNGHSILEVTPDRQIVWSIHQNDLPGITLAWITTLQVEPSGNIIFGNCHATEKNPQIIEIARDKKVVWTFKDFEHFGNALSNSLVVENQAASK